MHCSHRRPLLAAGLVAITLAATQTVAAAAYSSGQVAANDTLILPAEADADGGAPSAPPRPAAAQERMALGTPTAPIAGRGDERDGHADGAAEQQGDPTALARLDPRAGDIMQVMAALAAVISLIFITRTLLRRFGGGPAAGRPSGVLEVLARYPIARGQQLILLKLGRRIVFAHSSSGSMRALTEVIDRDEVAALLGRIEAGSSGREAMRFRSLLKRFQQEHDGASAGAVQSIAAPGHEHRADSEIIDLTRTRRGLFDWGRSGP